jgi:NADH-quinone oxidoreductase subunit J
MNAVLFWLFAVAACGGAVAVVVERNVVRMAFWLIVALGSVAGLFFLLGADFVGATQLLIYMGGTVVLLIFGVMLTATGPLSRTMTVRRGERFLAAVIGAALLSVFAVSLLAVDWDQFTSNPAPYAEGGTTRPLGLKLLGMDSERLRVASRGSGIDSREPALDSQLSTLNSAGYLLPFEIASVHLLVVLIGAAYLARAKRRGSRIEDRG